MYMMRTGHNVVLTGGQGRMTALKEVLPEVGFNP